MPVKLFSLLSVPWRPVVSFGEIPRKRVIIGRFSAHFHREFVLVCRFGEVALVEKDGGQIAEGVGTRVDINGSSKLRYCFAVTPLLQDNLKLASLERHGPIRECGVGIPTGVVAGCYE